MSSEPGGAPTLYVEHPDCGYGPLDAPAHYSEATEDDILAQPCVQRALREAYDTIPAILPPEILTPERIAEEARALTALRASDSDDVFQIRLRHTLDAFVAAARLAERRTVLDRAIDLCTEEMKPWPGDEDDPPEECHLTAARISGRLAALRRA